MFKETFKYYKAKWPEPNLSNVIDLPTVTSQDVFESRLPQYANEEIALTPWGVNPVSEWRLFLFSNHPGLQLLCNVFDSVGQRYWIARCLRDYSKCPPYRSNLQKVSSFDCKEDIIRDWWSLLQNAARLCSFDEHKRLKRAMRWSTLGYHHNWDSKIYNYKDRSEFPLDLSNMCAFVARSAGHSDFKAEAAIVNYYPLGTTLAGHVDKSEPNMEAPLFSFSFGQNAIFLLGGQTLDVRPCALMLKSGDVLIMSKESRLCYHAVPRVLARSKDNDVEPWSFANDFHCRSPLVNCNDKIRTRCDYNWSLENSICEAVMDEKQWSIYQNYLQDSRININVRQVL